MVKDSSLKRLKNIVNMEMSLLKTSRLTEIAARGPSTGNSPSRELPHAFDRPNDPEGEMIDVDSELSIPTPIELEAAARASLETPTVWEVAFHEAGHAIVPIDAGRFPELVYINDDIADRSHAGRNVFSMWLPSDWASSPLRAVFGPEARLLATTLLAGHVAEARARGSDHEAQGDREWAQSVLDDDPEDSDGEALASLMNELNYDEAVDLLVGARREANAVLGRRWPDVQQLASRLVRDRRLDRDDLWTMFPNEDSR